MRSAKAILLALGCAVALTACGSAVTGTPVRVTTDPSTVDAGNYRVEPQVLGNAKNDKQARSVEALRLADYVVLPFEADPSYVQDAWFVNPHIVLNRKALGSLVINDTFDDVAEDLVAGWVNSWSTGGPPEAPRRTLSIAVLMFPDAATAQRVGPALEHDDFTYNIDNQPVPITKYPTTTAHWRPGVSSLGSWTVHDRYVVFVKVDDNLVPPDLPNLVGHVERILDVQIPLLDEFEPTPPDQLAKIPLDPTGLLGRTLPSDANRPPRAEPDGVYTRRGAVTLMDGGAELLAELDRAEVDLMSFGDAVVFRSKTAAGATQLWRDWQFSTHLDPDQTLVDAPDGLGDHVECLLDSPSAESSTLDMNICMFQVDRYVVQAYGRNLRDLHQKMAAQYVLLTAK
ncbi:DUF7373 family lipoprotein [Nocardia farcinica]|uniref:PknH-like extracellular domain-containing protein n=1 Tax=Nocardia farcinica TaxID=37329 RepID=A0A449GNT3_NOCFR|nr:hypothetical protein [Nocardia farcinica]VFA94204.1 Uncharacterised protein [Nocardia farcinica]